MKKRNLIIPSIMTILLSGSLIAGATYSLFTSESTHDITVSSGTVNVESKVLQDTIKLTSLNQEMPSTTFANGGTFKLIEGRHIELDKMTPGDKVTLTVNIKNLSNVKAAYRVKLNCTNGYKLYGALKVTFDGISPWKIVEPSKNPEAEPGQDSTLTIELPENTGNDYQGLSTNISIVVEAYQGNATLPETTFDETVTNHTGETTIVKESREDVVVSTTTGSAKAILPRFKVADTADKVALNVTKVGEDSNFKFENDVQAQYYDITIDGTDPEVTSAVVDCELFIGKGLSNVKTYHTHSGETEKIDSTYDPNTGFVKFNTTKFSVFAFTADKVTPILDLVYVPEVKPTAQQVNGNIAYYKTRESNKYYLDPQAKEEITPSEVVTTYKSVKTLEELQTVVSSSENIYPYIYLENDLDFTDYPGNYAIDVKKTCIIDGQNFTINGTNPRASNNSNETTFVINNNKISNEFIDVRMTNLNLISTEYQTRAIDTRGNLKSLTLDNVNISHQGGGRHQSITIGGNQVSLTKVNLINCNVDSTINGVNITTFNPVSLYSKDSVYNGYGVMEILGQSSSAGSRGSDIYFKDCELTTINNSNFTFGAFALKDDDISITLDTVKATLRDNGGFSAQYLFSPNEESGRREIPYRLKITGNSLIDGSVFNDTSTYWEMDENSLVIDGGKYSDLNVGSKPCRLPFGYYTAPIEEAPYTLEVTDR